MDRWLAECEAEDQGVFTRVGDLVWQLRGEPEPRRAADRELIMLGTQHPRVAPRLAEFFEFLDPEIHHWEWEVIFPLGKVLGELASFRPEVAAALLRGAAEPLGHYRRQAATSGLTERFRHPTDAVVQVLLAHLTHESPSVRTAAAEALGQVDHPDATVLWRLSFLLGDWRGTIQEAAQRAFERILQAHPELGAVLPAVLQTDLYDDIARWYRGDESDFSGAVPALLGQSEPTRSILVAAIYGDDRVLRDFVIRSLAVTYQNPRDKGLTISAVLRRKVDKGLPPAFAGARDRIERFLALLDRAQLPGGEAAEPSCGICVTRTAPLPAPRRS